MDLSREKHWLEAIEEQGPWPFVSRRIYRHNNGSHHAWQSRHHRKGLSVLDPLELLPLHVLIRLGLWMPKDLNWWIGVIFAVGSAHFVATLQFCGTLLLKANTFDASLRGLSWWQQDLAVWVPDFVGSVLFLVSGYLALGETCHTYWDWKPQSLSWWITFTNLLGCVSFMISAFFAFVPREASPVNAAQISVYFTLLGAFGFLVGSLLVLPEASDAALHGSSSPAT